MRKTIVEAINFIRGILFIVSNFIILTKSVLVPPYCSLSDCEIAILAARLAG